MSDEGCDFAIGATERDGRIDSFGKRGDAILEVMPDDLHDCRFVLDDSDVGRSGKFGSCI